MKYSHFPVKPMLVFLLAISISVKAQDLIQDTLAVRILLDQNGLTDTPVSGVATVAAQRVTGLRLSGLELLRLPPEIGSLSALKYLTLSDNLLDSLPAEIWDLSALVELDLGGNRIGSLDHGIGRLGNLLLLGLRDNGLATLPAEVFALPQLTTLLLSGNQLDTLPDAVADPPFLAYLDLSGNRLRTIPFTMAAMDLDSLDLSNNVLESLPGLITSMKPGTRVHLAANRLCTLTGPLDAWAEAKEPGYKAAQICDAGVRPASAPAGGAVFTAVRIGDGLRLDFGGLANTPGGLEIRILDAAGREAARARAAAGDRSLEIPIASPGGSRGFLWAEARRAGKPAWVTPVIP